jgi:hypothetical protein
MMSSNQTMKVTPKRGETVIPDDPLVGIGLDTVPDPGGFNSDVMFDADDPPETTAASSSQKDGRVWTC